MCRKLDELNFYMEQQVLLLLLLPFFLLKSFSLPQTARQQDIEKMKALRDLEEKTQREKGTSELKVSLQADEPSCHEYT